MNTRDDINIRQDPSPLEGPQRMAYESRIGKKSERDTEDSIIASRGGNNGLSTAGDSGMLSGFHNDMYDYSPVAEDPPAHAPRRMSPHSMHHGHGRGHGRHHHPPPAQYSQGAPQHHRGAVNHCPHRPQCRFFMTFGYWCCLTPQEKNIIKSIRS